MSTGSPRVRLRRRRGPAVAASGLALAAVTALAACSSSGGASPQSGSATSGAATSAAATSSPAASGSASSLYDTPLAGVCPSTVVVQTNWWPQAEHGFTYELLGPDPTIDAQHNKVVGSLRNTGVKLEIRAGGPAIGYQQVSSLLYQDDSITLGYVGTDEAIQDSAKQPTVAVLSDLETNPQVFLWGDPSWNFGSVADIGKSGAKVLAFDGATYLDLFEAQGLLQKGQVDTSYNGSPDRFVTSDGKVVEQGFVTSEPYRLEHDVAQWGKPVKYLLVKEYPVYQSALAVRADKLGSLTPCLTKLVPIFQQALKDYVTDPGPVNQLLLKVVGKLSTSGFTLSAGLLADAAQKEKDLKLIANGRDGVLGSFDPARVQRLITQLSPVLAKKGTAPKSGLTPADLATNQFLDKTVRLPW